MYIICVHRENRLTFLRSLCLKLLFTAIRYIQLEDTYYNRIFWILKTISAIPLSYALSACWGYPSWILFEGWSKEDHDHLWNQNSPDEIQRFCHLHILLHCKYAGEDCSSQRLASSLGGGPKWRPWSNALQTWMVFWLYVVKLGTQIYQGLLNPSSHWLPPRRRSSLGNLITLFFGNIIVWIRKDLWRRWISNLKAR